MNRLTNREIPYNYTSADDRRIWSLVLGDDVLAPLEGLAVKRRTGRSWRLLMRVVGEVFIHRRNPFLYRELLDDRDRRQRFFNASLRDVALIAERGKDEAALAPVLEKCRHALETLRAELNAATRLRERMRRRLGAVIGGDNVFFDPFTLAAHATDATDWRLHLPVAVARPGEEDQIPPLLQAIAAMGLKAIPRGGGTGLTGGAVPVAADCVIINTEKLNRIGGVDRTTVVTPDGRETTLPTIAVEAGVITDAARTAAAAAGFVFATDPTSAWACTIGGNIAENAGGKRAVLWGTTIDNLLSFRIAIPDGRLLEVRRSDPSGRRIDPQEDIHFSVTDTASGEEISSICIHGWQLRKPGLGKDITNKTLEGLPGVQKEGTDGIITSAVFILHKAYAHERTICLEFFGDDMEEAAQVIDLIVTGFKGQGHGALSALEHFDEEYVRAIQYKAKAPQRHSPKAVLLIDVVADSPGALAAGLSLLANCVTDRPNTFLTVAKDPQEAQRFWRDRKRLGAIAARTNAFKLNEDIVLPIGALAEFAEFVDGLNIEEERNNQKEVVWQLLAYLERAVPVEDPEWLTAKLPSARELLHEAMAQIKLAGRSHLREETHLRTLQTSLRTLFRGFSKVTTEIDREVEEIRSRRIVVATHMHAGDGNVHVNIPVFSNDREMMLRAAEVADTIMERAVALDGVVSGEHGIGFTKIKHIDADILAAFRDYQKTADPGDLINPGKLTDRGVAGRVFATSFSLIELEARILRYGGLEQLAEKISQCVRCGRCKTDCCVFYPSGNLFYHPRSKNLALTAIIEAILYDAQHAQSVGLRPLRWLGDIADHCTLCHKCLAPCPVNIDTADVSVLEREVLAEHKARQTPLPTRLVLGYLASRSPLTNTVMRRGMLQWGGSLQRTAARLAGRFNRRPAAMRALYAPAPAIARRPLTAFIDVRGAGDNALVLSPASVPTATVFYFPGCGSERLHADIAMATLFLMVSAGVRVVLPPPYLCCGFPARANAKTDLAVSQELRNTIIFNQMRSMLGHLDFDACAVTCGTCRESLANTRATAAFDAPLIDAAAFIMANGTPAVLPEFCYYHRPCHDSLDGRGEALLTQVSPNGVQSIPGCCSEAGTLALSRPDIAAAMLARKRGEINARLAGEKNARLVTNCPACVTGLGRQQRLAPWHLTVALAEAEAPGSWHGQAVDLLARAEKIRF
jgi:FAD/FMN-containing dehydrogenase/Fe-S oxidoreductase